MSQTVTVNGQNYTIPDVGDEDWGQNVTDYLVALAVIGSLTQSWINHVSVSSSPISTISGRTYLVNTSSARTLTLPAAASNAFIIVKDTTGSASSNNITIARAGSEQIDGVAANKTLARAYGTWMLVCDGTNWWTINQFPDSGLVNTDVATAAAIARSKLASGTANRMVVNDASGVMSDAAAITAARALISDANGIPTHSSVTSTELGYLSGVTSALQTQINAKITAGTGAIVNADVNASAAIAVSKLAALTASRAVVTDGSGFISAHASTTATEVGYLNGVTSAIQTQLNGKVATTLTLTAAGLVTGGGDLSANRTFTVTAATQSDQETGNSTAVAVVPGVQKYHPSAAKAWALFDGSGTPSLTANFGISSITDNGTGDFTFNLSTAMSSANYCVLATGGGNSNSTTSGCWVIRVFSLATGGPRITFARPDNGALTDPTAGNLAIFGDV